MIRLAFLGCGRIANAHAKRLRKHRSDVAVSFASRQAARAQAFAAACGGTAYASYEAALASSEVDAVAVTTPPHTHLSLALAALGAGKHVVLEKPPLPRAADFVRVADAAAAAGKRVFVAENYQYKPLLRRVRGLLADGLVGDVLFIHINAIKHQRDHGWRADPALALGGALYEGGIHWVDFMASLGAVRSVHGVCPKPSAAIERSMMVSFEYEAGPAGMLSYSWEVPSTAKGLRLSKIYGRAGTITFETNGLWLLLHGKKTRIYIPGLRDLSGYAAMWADFVSAWNTGEEPAMTLAKARRDLELVEQAYATAAVTSAE